MTGNIATPVNKPREAQSLWELPALRPSGGAQSFWPWYYIYKYYIIYYYTIILYIELRESQTATFTFPSMLQFKQTPRNPNPYESSPRYGHPEEHRAFGRDIRYTNIILYTIILSIELRESQTATFTFSSMLQFTPDCTALSLVERWLAVTLHM